MITIRSYREQDWPEVWKILEPVFRAGTTYAYSPEISEEEAKKEWIEAPMASFVYENEEKDIVGTYYIKPNQPALGAHVCNCGYIVDGKARGRGAASAMCKHSQEQAIKAGFTAMQYNLVVSTNEGAIRLWKKHGFKEIGVLPKAFKHKKFGFVDAVVMYKELKA